MNNYQLKITYIRFLKLIPIFMIITHLIGDVAILLETLLVCIINTNVKPLLLDFRNNIKL